MPKEQVRIIRVGVADPRRKEWLENQTSVRKSVEALIDLAIKVSDTKEDFFDFLLKHFITSDKNELFGNQDPSVISEALDMKNKKSSDQSTDDRKGMDLQKNYRDLFTKEK